MSELIREHARAVRVYSRAHGRALEVLGVSSACGGCTSAACCLRDSPPVSRPEAEVLAELVQIRADLEDVPGLIGAQLEILRRTAGPGRGIRDRRDEFPCVFLSSERRCRIYSHRPLACVHAFSPDRHRCGASTDGTGAWDLPVAESAAVIREALDQGGRPVARALAFMPTSGDVPPPLVVALAIALGGELRDLLVTAAGAARASGAMP